MLTQMQLDGSRSVIEWERPKIVSVPKWRGAMTYWGLALYEQYKWSTYDWLRDQASKAKNFNSVEDFARFITDELNSKISSMDFVRPIDSGIGIHFTAYERIDDYWIPELFLISNWKDPSYTALRTKGVGLSRETYHTVANVYPDPSHRERKFRLEVHSKIQEGLMLRYNNGDPVLFNQSANAILTMFGELYRRGKLDDPKEVKIYLSIARRSIEIVSNVQRDFCKGGTRTVGGKPHDLAITPRGEYFSTTGDK